MCVRRIQSKQVSARQRRIDTSHVRRTCSELYESGERPENRRVGHLKHHASCNSSCSMPLPQPLKRMVQMCCSCEVQTREGGRSCQRGSSKCLEAHKDAEEITYSGERLQHEPRGTPTVAPFAGHMGICCRRSSVATQRFPAKNSSSTCPSYR